MIDTLILFTDGSVDTQLKIGFGAYLAVHDLSTDLEEMQVKVRKFEDTSSTKLELQTLLWALTEIRGASKKNSCLYRFSKHYWIAGKAKPSGTK